ncbi:uncharacterized protein [Glycine max]|uniref:EGF-like domain-containing protein n=1 Tax=Glycine max TaxID=3847 RepID=A0A0R0HYK6_SOYBN|nr:uncharacterized protein LOC100816071 isoform X2 [Glycine max]
MAFASAIAFLLLHTLSSVRSDFLSPLSPLVAPLYGTMDSSCSNAPAPAQQERKANESIFDACHWVDCGGGSCNKTSLFSYSCNCDAGYYNLLNATALPCFRECAIGFGCSNLGISMTNSSTASPPPPLNENASLILKGSSPWLLVLIIFIANMQLQ